MPQLDLVSFLPQLFWFVIIILSLYVHLAKHYLPSIKKALLVRDIFKLTAQGRTQSHLIFRKLIAMKLRVEINIRELLSFGFKDSITLKNGRQLRQQQTEQTSWKGSWFGSFLLNSASEGVRACTKTIATINNNSNLRLKDIVINLARLSFFSVLDLKNMTILMRFYLLALLKKSRN